MRILHREVDRINFNKRQGYQWLPVVTSGYQWLPVVTSGYQWLQVVTQWHN